MRTKGNIESKGTRSGGSREKAKKGRREEEERRGNVQADKTWTKREEVSSESFQSSPPVSLS